MMACFAMSLSIARRGLTDVVQDEVRIVIVKIPKAVHQLLRRYVQAIATYG